jgi:hypothetical protein
MYRLSRSYWIRFCIGAVLRFSDRFEDYLPFVKIRWEGTVMNTLSPLIYAHDAENLTITGRGTLDGNGFKWWSWEKETRELIKKNGGKLPALNKLQKRKNSSILIYRQPPSHPMKLIFFIRTKPEKSGSLPIPPV